MSSVLRLSLVSFFVTLLFAITAPASAMELMDQSGNLFNFQMKLANKGNPVAQYRVGFMYERGIGTQEDAEKAVNWYKKSVKQGNVDAENRLTYLEIVSDGYLPELHQNWLSKVKAEAGLNRSEAVFLLAQLYENGIGVKKNLSKSLDMLYRLSAEGIVTADVEIKKIESRQAKDKSKHKQYASKKKAVRVEKTAKTQPELLKIDLAGQKATGSGEKTVALTRNEVSPEDAALALKEEKRRRYEAVMKKIADEQAEIDSVQQWVDGSEVASATDEF